MTAPSSQSSYATDPGHALRTTVAMMALLLAAPTAHAADEIHWTFTGATSVAVDWRGSENVIRYGLTASYGSTVNAATPSPLPFSSSGPFWEAKITGLDPSTTYHYSIGTGPDHVFHTPLTRGASDFTIFAQGDLGDSVTYRNGIPNVQNLVVAHSPKFVLMVGDLTYANAHGQMYCDQHFNDMMKWSTNAAYMPAWGNHEWDKPCGSSTTSTSACDDLRNYKGRFALPNPRAAAGVTDVTGPGEDWYWFDYGNARFIAYPEPTSGAWAAWSASADSIMSQVDNDPQISYVVTFGHRPAYSSGHHPGDHTLAGYLGTLGTKHPKYVLDLCGHSHNYERTIPLSGVTHITNGEGGATQETDVSGGCSWLGGCPAPYYTAYRAFHHGALMLRFTATAIEGTMFCGPADSDDDVSCTSGTAIDTFSIPAVGAPPVADTTKPGTTSNLSVKP